MVAGRGCEERVLLGLYNNENNRLEKEILMMGGEGEGNCWYG